MPSMLLVVSSDGSSAQGNPGLCLAPGYKRMTDWLSSSPPDFDVHGRAVALIGMAATGLAAARVLVRRGAIVSAHDPKPAEALEDTLAQLRELGVSCFVGSAAYTG